MCAEWVYMCVEWVWMYVDVCGWLLVAAFVPNFRFAAVDSFLCCEFGVCFPALGQLLE